MEGGREGGSAVVIYNVEYRTVLYKWHAVKKINEDTFFSCGGTKRQHYWRNNFWRNDGKKLWSVERPVEGFSWRLSHSQNQCPFNAGMSVIHVIFYSWVWISPLSTALGPNLWMGDLIIWPNIRQNCGIIPNNATWSTIILENYFLKIYLNNQWL